MNRLFKAVLLAFTLAAIPRFVMAEAYIIPQDSFGNVPSDANQAGVDVIDTTMTFRTGLTTPVMLYWVMVSSDVVGNSAVLRDTDTLNTTSNVKMTVFPCSNGGTSLTAASTICQFNPPVLFRNGISINLIATPAGSAAQTGTVPGRWHFGIRRRMIGNARGVDTSFADTSD